MRTLIQCCGLALLVSLGCSQKQRRTNTHWGAYEEITYFYGPCRTFNECRRTVRLCKRAAREAERLLEIQRAGRFKQLAEQAKRLALPRAEMLRYARRAFDLYVTNGWYLNADTVFHKFRIEDDVRHLDLVIRTYAALKFRHVPYASLDQDREWQRRHPLDELSALRAYELAMQAQNFEAAEIVARRFRLSERQYLDARRAKLAKEFEEAVVYDAHTFALSIAENSDARIPREQVLEVARRAYEVNLQNGAPFEAHKIAAKYNLGESYLRRALDAAFADAVSRGTYQLARQLPSGEFMIIAPPR